MKISSALFSLIYVACLTFTEDKIITPLALISINKTTLCYLKLCG